MSKPFVQNKYNVGDVVSAKASPSLGLVISRYKDQVYYCKVQEDPERKELVYFERELVEDLALEAKNKKGQVWENEGGGLK
jgi:heat shock protein HspQ